MLRHLLSKHIRDIIEQIPNRVQRTSRIVLDSFFADVFLEIVDAHHTGGTTERNTHSHPLHKIAYSFIIHNRLPLSQIL